MAVLSRKYRGLKDYASTLPKRTVRIAVVHAEYEPLANQPSPRGSTERMAPLGPGRRLGQLAGCWAVPLALATGADNTQCQGPGGKLASCGPASQVCAPYGSFLPPNSGLPSPGHSAYHLTPQCSGGGGGNDPRAPLYDPVHKTYHMFFRASSLLPPLRLQCAAGSADTPAHCQLPPLRLTAAALFHLQRTTWPHLRPRPSAKAADRSGATGSQKIWSNGRARKYTSNLPIACDLSAFFRTDCLLSQAGSDLERARQLHSAFHRDSLRKLTTNLSVA